MNNNLRLIFCMNNRTFPIAEMKDRKSIMILHTKCLHLQRNQLQHVCMHLEALFTDVYYISINCIYSPTFIMKHNNYFKCQNYTQLQ